MYGTICVAETSADGETLESVIRADLLNQELFCVDSSWLGADGADHRLAARIQNADLCRKTAKCPTFAPELHQNPVRW